MFGEEKYLEQGENQINFMFWGCPTDFFRNKII